MHCCALPCTVVHCRALPCRTFPRHCLHSAAPPCHFLRTPSSATSSATSSAPPSATPSATSSATTPQVNSLDTDLDLKQREKLYPTIGLLFPEGTSRLAKQLAPKREQPTYWCRHSSAALPRRCIRRWVDAGLCHALERRDRAAPMPVWGRGATCYHVPAQHSLLSLSHG